MAIIYTHRALNKLEQILVALHDRVRYDKGNFNTSACMIEKIVRW